MTKSHTTAAAAILVAVDIAKDHNEVLIELRHNHRRRFRVANTLEEYERILWSVAPTMRRSCRRLIIR